MVESVAAFGYSVPLTVVVVLIALVIGLVLAVTFWLTVGLSVYRSVGDTRRKRLRDDLADQLVDRAFDPETDWERWVAGLSATEREVAESLLDEYLRELDGQSVETLQNLGDELGIPGRAKRNLCRRGEHHHLRALTWLTVLNRPARLQTAGFTPQTPRERAAVVRLRHETGGLDQPREGVSLLLDGATEPFTVFGQDTLYRVATDEPGALLETAAENYRTWSEPLLVQVLTVCQHLGTSVTTENLSWLTATLEHDSEVVRAAAARALGNVGWRGDVREDPFVDRLVRDPSPRVRGAVYQTLARWGDERALGTLTDAVRTEDHPPTRLAGTNALVRRRDRLQGDVSAALANSWAWSREHASYDRVARQRTEQVGD